MSQRIGDQTILMPTPGGHDPGGLWQAPVGEASVEEVAWPDLDVGLNPLEQAAAPLLALLTRVARLPQHADVPGLRERVEAKIRAFDVAARRLGVSDDQVTVARYALCAALDEAVLNTPWGSTSDWSRRRLVGTFHGEAEEPDLFFRLLARAMKAPAASIDLLELMYLLLSLGFQGRYRTATDGRSELQALHDQLYQTIRQQRDEPAPTLAPPQAVVLGRGGGLASLLPVWVVLALVGVVLLAVYVGFSFALNRASDPVLHHLHALEGTVAPLLPAIAEPSPALQPAPAAPVLAEPSPPLQPAPAAPVLAEPSPALQPAPAAPNLAEPAVAAPAPAAHTLSELLAEDVAHGRLLVYEDPRMATAVLQGDSLFATARATPAADFEPVIERLAAALQRFSGSVLVVGHTDNVPIFNPRFPSNWHLSNARARSVADQLLLHGIDPARLQVLGQADTEPRYPNDSAANRQRNRRVEVMLIKARSRSAADAGSLIQGPEPTP